MAIALLLQPRCSEKSVKESGGSLITTRILVQRSQIGCLTGKGGAIISEMRNITRANIRIISDENLPRVASEEDDMVQITGGFDAASSALSHVIMRLKSNLFGRDGALASIPHTIPYVPMPMDIVDAPRHGSRDGHLRGRGYSSPSGGDGSLDLAPPFHYGGGESPSSDGEVGYGVYGGSSYTRSGGMGT